MSQNDYKESIEEHRQSIDVDTNGTTGKPTRMSRNENRNHNRKPKKNRNNSLLTVLAVLFVMIPVAIFVYNQVFTETQETVKPEKTTDKVVIESNTDSNEKNKVNSDDGKTTDSNAKAESSSNEDTKAAKEKAAKEKAAKEKAAKEKAAKEKAEKEKTTETVNTQSNAYQNAIQNGYLHNAVEGDTIQSISIKYYGSEDKVDQIKQLNGITADRVPAGTKVALVK